MKISRQLLKLKLQNMNNPRLYTKILKETQSDTPDDYFEKSIEKLRGEINSSVSSKYFLKILMNF